MVSHAIDQGDVPNFFANVETIKTNEGTFSDEIPSFVSKKIRNIFGKQTQDLDEVVIVENNRVTVNVPRSSRPIPMLVKTPIWAIAHCLERIFSPTKCYRLDRCQILELGQAADDAYLIEGFLNLKRCPEEFSDHNRHIPLGPKMNYVDKQTSKSKHIQVQVLTAVLYIPSVGKFYSPLVIARTPRLDSFARASGDMSRTGLNKVLVACSAADLRIERQTGHPSRGGYFDEFTSVYRIVVTPKSGETTEKTFLTGYHVRDSEAFGAPDVYANMRQGSYPTPDHNSYDFTRRFYVQRLNAAGSNCSGCRQYVDQGYFAVPQHCLPEAMVIDSGNITDKEEIVIRVIVKKSDLNHVDNQCTIRIQRVVSSPDWHRCRALCIGIGTDLLVNNHGSRGVGACPVHQQPLSADQCAYAGLPHHFDGWMYALGKHVPQYEANKRYIEYPGTGKLQPNLCIACELLTCILTRRLHWETQCLRQVLKSYDEKPPQSVGGDKGLTKFVNVSVNLANPLHYDPTDENVGAAVWMERDLDHPADVYFIMPNLLVKDSDGISRQGLIVKLKDGCIILWDGNEIRHGTSLRVNPGETSLPQCLFGKKTDMFAFHFANSVANLKFINEVHQWEYTRKMGNRLMDWDAFAQVVYPNEDIYW